MHFWVSNTPARHLTIDFLTYAAQPSYHRSFKDALSPHEQEVCLMPFTFFLGYSSWEPCATCMDITDCSTMSSSSYSLRKACFRWGTRSNCCPVGCILKRITSPNPHEGSLVGSLDIKFSWSVRSHYWIVVHSSSHSSTVVLGNDIGDYIIRAKKWILLTHPESSPLHAHSAG